MADAEDRDAELHEVRKDAKRLRYAAEAVHTVWGKDAKRLAKAAKKLTSHLGERQDTVMSRPDLLEIARRGRRRRGELGDLGRPARARGGARRRAGRSELPRRCGRRSPAKKLRRWLR